MDDTSILQEATISYNNPFCFKQAVFDTSTEHSASPFALCRKGERRPGSHCSSSGYLSVSSTNTAMFMGWFANILTAIPCGHIIYKDASAQRLRLCAAGHKVDFSLEYCANFITLSYRAKKQSCPPTLLFCFYSMKKFLQTLSWRQTLYSTLVPSFCIIGFPSIIHTSESRSVDVLLLTECSSARSSE